MKYKVAKTLLDHLEEFEAQTGHNDLPAFSVWLSERLSKTEMNNIANPEPDTNAHYNSHDGLLASGIGTISQYTKHYFKTALKNSPLVSIHDFIFLLTLKEKGDMRKKEIIDYNYLEFSPGMEVIRRLLRKDLIEEYDDPNDKRSKRVRIKEAGEDILRMATIEINQAHQIIGGNLSKQEKLQFINLLQKLVHFHHPIWHDDFGEHLQSIREKYLNPS